MPICPKFWPNEKYLKLSILVKLLKQPLRAGFVGGHHRDRSYLSLQQSL